MKAVIFLGSVFFLLVFLDQHALRPLSTTGITVAVEFVGEGVPATRFHPLRTRTTT